MADIFKISRTLAMSGVALPDRVKKAFDDPFAQELLKLWEDRKKRGQLYVAYLYSAPVGFCLVEQEGIGKAATVRGMFVKSDFRGNDIGTILIRSVIRDFGLKDIWVNISDGAQGFWDRFNFEIIMERADLPEDAGKQFLACRVPEGKTLQECISSAGIVVK